MRRPLEAEQRERRVRPRDEDEDHRVVERRPRGVALRSSTGSGGRGRSHRTSPRAQPRRPRTTRSRAGRPRVATSTTPAAIAATNAHWWKTPRSRGLSSASITPPLSHAAGFRRIDGCSTTRSGAGASRRRCAAAGIDLLFVGLSSDLEYLSGVDRGIPFFGQSSYPHGWVAGGFFRPDADPVFVLPRMVVVFDLPVRPDGQIVVVDETDDGRSVFERVARGLGPVTSVAVGDRVWAETTIELGRIFGLERLRTGSAIVNRLRRVKTDAELDAMARSCRTVEAAMGAVAPRVAPGVTMAELREEVEAQLRAAGSLTPSFATHIFTGMDPDSLDTGTATASTPLAAANSTRATLSYWIYVYTAETSTTVAYDKLVVQVRNSAGAVLTIFGKLLDLVPSFPMRRLPLISLHTKDKPSRFTLPAPKTRGYKLLSSSTTSPLTLRQPQPPATTFRLLRRQEL